MRQDTTLTAYGTVGNSQAQNTPVVTLPLTTGRWRLSGMVRHTLADGCKIVTPVALIITSGPNDTAAFGPLVADVVAGTNFVIQLNTATGASDTASATVYAEKINH